MLNMLYVHFGGMCVILLFFRTKSIIKNSLYVIHKCILYKWKYVKEKPYLTLRRNILQMSRLLSCFLLKKVFLMIFSFFFMNLHLHNIVKKNIKDLFFFYSVTIIGLLPINANNELEFEWFQPFYSFSIFACIRCLTRLIEMILE